MLYFRNKIGCQLSDMFLNILSWLFLICLCITIAQIAAAGLSLIISERICATEQSIVITSKCPNAVCFCLECYCCSFTAHVSIILTNEMLSWWWVPHHVISCLFTARFLLGNMCLDLRGESRMWHTGSPVSSLLCCTFLVLHCMQDSSSRTSGLPAELSVLYRYLPEV